MIKINCKILGVFLIFFVFFLTSVYASEYTVSNIKIDDVVRYEEDFNISVFVSNNTDSSQNIVYDLNIFSPRGVVVYSKSVTVNVSAHSTKEDMITITWGLGGGRLNPEQAKSSNNSYLVQAVAIGGTEIVGAVKRNYFIISAGQRKIPISDMPIILSFIFLILVVVIFSKKNKK